MATLVAPPAPLIYLPQPPGRKAGVETSDTRAEVRVMKKKKHRFLRCLLLMSAIGGAVVYWNGLDESRKRFLIHLGKEAPYTPFRYFA